jgi:hypothetical protein
MSDSTKSMLSGIYEMGKSVREYIDQNGGGGGGAGGSGGLGINPYITGQSNFYSSLPDQIVLTNVAGTVNAAFSLYYVTSTSIFYHSPFIGTQPYIIFDNNASATFDEYRNTDASVFGAGQSLSGYISSGRAVYLGGGGSSTFEDLTDTPSTLTEGSGQYLKVSDDGQTIEYVDLPAGGGGSYGLIASKMDGINFTGELPDIIFQKDSSDLEAALILQIQNSATNKIQYGANTAGTNRILRFDNSATAGNMTNNGTWNLGSNSPGSVSIQHFIDTDKAIYLGGGSSNGGGGGGSLSYETKTLSSDVSNSSSPHTADITELTFNNLEHGQDYLVNACINRQTENAANDFVGATVKHGNDVLFELGVWNEDSKIRETSCASKIITATGDITVLGTSLDGDSKILAGSYVQVAKLGDSSNGGGGGSSSSNGSSISVVNQIQDNIDNIPLIGSGVQIPDAILIKDTDATTTNGYDNLIQLDFALWSNVHDTNGNITSQHFAYETNNFATKRWYIRFDSTDGSYNSHSEDQHVKKEFNSIQEYISNDRALYFGGGGSGDSGGSSSTFSASSYQENILQNDITADDDTNFNDLHFTGLENGAYYRLGGQVLMVNGFDANNVSTSMIAYQDSYSTDNIVGSLTNRGTLDNQTATFNHIFQATGDLFFTGIDLDGAEDRYIYGNGTKSATFLQLEKL